MNPHEVFKDQLANGATLLSRGSTFICRKGTENVAMAIEHGYKLAAPAPIASLKDVVDKVGPVVEETPVEQPVAAKKPRKPRTKK